MDIVTILNTFLASTTTTWSSTCTGVNKENGGGSDTQGETSADNVTGETFGTTAGSVSAHQAELDSVVL